ncbi:hypothetical protein JCGZ_07053 [Jatropha curcas]|uniref:Peptidase A1 domain-containing protein n=1 Tax=Jatropha curcas TaxID=180498 RepID=A0A067KBH1_JATCU|nr:hypothetical protein JCGZ_07053 [Jatropha curcas]
MATPLSSISSISFLFYALIVLVCPCCSLQKSLHTHNFKLTSLLASNVCNRSSKVHKQGSSLEIVHKDGPCNEKMKDDFKTEISASHYQEMLLQDQLRVDTIHARFTRRNNSGPFDEMQAKLPLQSGVAIGTGNYFVTVSLGTPQKDLSLIFDTGSDITWTQCEPCVVSCYQQGQPIFEPRKSSSYANVSCSSSYCNLITESGGKKGCSSSTCLYKVVYGDGTYSVGFFATEKLTVTKSDTFNKYVFGCGQSNAGRLGRAAGLLGLGRSQLSFAFQTAKKYKKLFSYCIPPTSSSTGHLSFGGNIGKTVKFTPMSPDFQSTPYYGIDITGISVGGDKLAVSASVYQTAGAIIDSGTVITRLPPTVYSALSSKFQEMMTEYPMTDGFSILDTCYDFSDFDTVTVPKISVFFKGGVEVDIYVTGILIVVDGIEKVCLAFAPNQKDSEFAIFGNTQQQTYEVLHDLAKERVGFAPAACS